ncbi:MAG: hypothetical protein PQJ45_05190 [Sphaerochaetaceae bacterium]|nr:hypothetical protein [Sphaerochaetaceae bacterium]
MYAYLKKYKSTKETIMRKFITLLASLLIVAPAILLAVGLITL